MALEPELSLQLILDDDRRRDVEQMSGETFQRIDVFDLEPLLYVLRYDIMEQWINIACLIVLHEQFRESALPQVLVESSHEQSHILCGQWCCGYAIIVAPVLEREWEQFDSMMPSREMGGQLATEQFGIAAGKQ